MQNIINVKVAVYLPPMLIEYYCVHLYFYIILWQIFHWQFVK